MPNPSSGGPSSGWARSRACLNRGARMLRETQAPLATIARQVGYSSEYAFAHAFRRKFGVARAGSAPG
jgi:transcriptional regulator GlxA family with amidase domain